MERLILNSSKLITTTQGRNTCAKTAEAAPEARCEINGNYAEFDYMEQSLANIALEKRDAGEWDQPDDVDDLESASVNGFSDDESMGSVNASSRAKLKSQTPTDELRDAFIRLHRRVYLSSSASKKPTEHKDTPYTDELIKKKQYLTITKHHEIRDAKFDDQCNIILSTQSSVQLYDANGVFREKLFKNRVTEPWGLHVERSSGNILVSDYAENCVKEFNVLGIIVQEYGKVTSPGGITVSDTGYLFVCSPAEGCVHVYNKKGQLITLFGSKVLSCPTSVALHQNSILVSDRTKIIGFDIYGEVEFVYKQEEDAEKPSCICTDAKYGYVLVTGYSKNRMIALNQKMKRAIKVKDTKSPTLCTVSQYGQLLVGEKHRTGTALKIFRLK